MTSHRSSPRPHLPHLAWLVSALLLLSLLGGPATSAPPALTLHSPAPGELHLTWPATTPAPPAYHVQYAPADTPLLIKEATSPTHTLTLYDLEPGVVYTVQVRAGTGPWSVPGLQRIDDYRADPETVGTIGVGAAETGYIESAGDTDWFFVDLAAGEGYPIEVTGAPAPPLAVYDATGVVVQQGLAWHHAGALTFTPATAGLYHLAVGGPEAAPGYYTLTVDEPPTTGSRRSRTLAGATPTAAPAPQRATAAPAKPRGLTATATHDGVVLTWDDPQDASITGYVILRRVRENDVGGEFSVLVADTGSAATTYTDATVQANTTYTYRIKAINAHGVSPRSRWFHIDIPAAPEPEGQAAEPPAKPRGLSATATHDQVVLTWDDPGDDSITGYVILRRNRQTTVSGQFSELVADTGSAATTYTDDTVAPETNYTYRIKAINQYGVSERSRWFHIDTPAASERPDKPTGLTAETVAHDTVTLTWDDPQDDTITGYAVVRWTLGYNSSGIVTIAADTGTADPSYTDETVQPRSEYLYNIKAINAQGESEKSEPLRVKTPAAPDPALPPARPTGVVSASSSDLVLLSWADPGDDTVTGYRILRRLWAGDEPDDFRTLAEDTGTAETDYADDTVETGRVYVYRVLAINAGGVSEPSRDVRVRTAAPVAPRTGARAHVATDLLSNFGQTSADTQVSTQTTDYYLGFTTGSNELGYNLISVKLDGSSGSGTEEGVELWSATSDATPLPGARIAALTHATGTWVTGKNTFNAPAGTRLKTDTTYFVLVSLAADFETTQSTSADTGSAPGWTLDQLIYVSQITGDWTDSSSIFFFAVEGSYVLNPDPPGQNVSEPPGGDCGSGSATQCRVAVGGSVTGNIADREAFGNLDLDAFAVELVQGETYQFDLEGADTGQGTLTDPVFRIKDLSSGDLDVAQDDNGGEDNNARVTFTPSKSETFHVVAEGARDRATGLTDTGTYRLTVRNVRNVSVSEPDGEDCSSGTDTECSVAVGGSATGNIDSDTNIDKFEVQLEVGHTYQIDVEGADTGQGTLTDPILRHLQGSSLTASGTIFQGTVPDTTDSDSGKGKNARLTFTVPDDLLAGAFYISVSGENDATGTYRLRVREVVGSGYGREMPLEGRLQVGSELSGTLPVHDGYFGKPHYFALDGLEVGRYTVSFSTGGIDSIHTFWRRPDNPDLDDVWLLADQAFGRSSYTFDVRPHTVGTHYALLYIRNGAGGDFTATLEEAMPSLTVDGPAVDGEIREDVGNIYPGYGTYMLFYSVDLEDGETYRVDIQGKDTCGDCTMKHTMLGHVQAPDGSFVEDDNNLFAYGGGEGRNTHYVFTADQDGTYFLKVGGRIFAFDGGATSRYRAGTFKVSIREDVP